MYKIIFHLFIGSVVTIPVISPRELPGSDEMMRLIKGSAVATGPFGLGPRVQGPWPATGPAATVGADRIGR
jgi:hypothetical protein